MNQITTVEDVYSSYPLENPQQNVWVRGSLHSMPTHKSHQITAISPKLLTLLIVGRRFRTWCFWTDKGLVPWHKVELNEGELS
jgi:hypothetical protein